MIAGSGGGAATSGPHARVDCRPCRRSARRPRPTASETITKVLGFAAVAGATIFVIWQLRPDLLFSPNMDVGGDNAGHVATPYFLIHDLLPQGRITGWDPQWFEGFPLYVFYFPLPALFVAALSVAFPYAVAFKLVTVLGPVTLPAAAWAFGRLADFKRPIPVLMAVATLPFLFNTSYTIEGGNLTSTLAGEFSFSLALTSGLLFLGVFAYALADRPAPLAGGCPVRGDAALPRRSGARLRGRRDRARAEPLGQERVAGARARSGSSASLLAAFWLVPFAVDLPYSSSMGYTRVTGLWSNILPRGYLWMIIPARPRHADRPDPPRPDADRARGRRASERSPGFQWLPAGFVYNGRWLPFYFLFTALLAAYGVGEFFRLAGALARARRLAGAGRDRRRQLRRPDRRRRRRRHRHPRLPAQRRPDRSARLDLVELHRLPGKVGLAGLPGNRAHARPGRSDVRLRAAAVRVHHRDADPLRLHRGDDGVAVLDQRVHGHHRRRAVRVLDDDAVSLPRPGRVLAPGRVVEPGLVPELSRLQPRRRDQASAVRRRAVLPRRLASGRSGGQERAGARQDRVRRRDSPARSTR